MRIIRDFNAIDESSKGCVLALGNFDGIHRGHQFILNTCTDIAHREECSPAVMTFEPHPREFFARSRGQHAPLRIYPLRRKLELLEELGISTVFLIRFNTSFAQTTADAFIDQILVQKLAVRHVVTGANFAFGHQRSGNAEKLCAKAGNYGFGYTAIPSHTTDDGAVISSSAIREALRQGDVSLASLLLGHPYQLSGHVMHGDKRGRTIGFPTANIRIGHLCTPRFGVYAARVGINDGACTQPAVINIGKRPTFGGSHPVLEAHLLELDANLYECFIRIELTHFIRDEQAFVSPDALRQQIQRDCQQAALLLQPSQGAMNAS